MHLCVVAGISGLGKRDIARKLVGQLKRRRVAGSPKVGKPADVEQELQELIPSGSPVWMGDRDRLAAFIGQAAPEEVRDKWKLAYQRAVEKATAGNPDVAVVCACLEYYRFETYEYFSPLDRAVIRASRPRQILTLIDDVFDVYYRLARAGEVFDIKKLITGKTKRAFGGAPGRDLRALYKDALSTVVESLLRILVWREKEIAAGANLARGLNIGHAVLAVKHPVDTGVRLLLGEASRSFGCGRSYPVYVSHPISRPRGARQSAGRWPPIVPNMDSVLDALANAKAGDIHIVPVRPTAIDEFRLLDDGTHLQPYLTTRWPFCEKRSMYCLPKVLPEGRKFVDYPDFELRGLGTIFDPPLDEKGRRVGVPLPDAEVSGILRTLNEAVRLQMAGRDHLLVRQCPGVFLYRPVYDEGEFSRGVVSEINTFCKTRDYVKGGSGKPVRRLAFIHDVEDAERHFGLEDPGEDPSKERYRAAVHDVAAAIEERARELTGAAEGGVVTRSPARLSEKTVADAVTEYDNVENKVQRIHGELFPPAVGGSIGTVEALSWEGTRESLIEALLRARARSLAHGTEDDLEYVFAEDGARCEFPERGRARFANYVGVVRGLDRPDRIKKAAQRVARFFACGTSRCSS